MRASLLFLIFCLIVPTFSRVPLWSSIFEIFEPITDSTNYKLKNKDIPQSVSINITTCNTFYCEIMGRFLDFLFVVSLLLIGHYYIRQNNNN